MTDLHRSFTLGSGARYLRRLPSGSVARSELRPRPRVDAAPLTPAGSIDEWVASAERIRSTLAMRVAEARERLIEAEARAAAAPELLQHLGGIVAEAERCVEIERAQAGVATDPPRSSRRS